MITITIKQAITRLIYLSLVKRVTNLNFKEPENFADFSYFIGCCTEDVNNLVKTTTDSEMLWFLLDLVYESRHYVDGNLVDRVKFLFGDFGVEPNSPKIAKITSKDDISFGMDSTIEFINLSEALSYFENHSIYSPIKLFVAEPNVLCGYGIDTLGNTTTIIISDSKNVDKKLTEYQIRQKMMMKNLDKDITESGKYYLEQANKLVNEFLSKPTLPTIGETYNYFDDGKISESRLLKVTIKEIIPFTDIDDKNLQYWKNEIWECYWLYEKETDYFIKGELCTIEGNLENVFFVRSKSGWFSLGFWAGRLDVDGSLTKSMTIN